MTRKVAIIGAGPAGIEAAVNLSHMGVEVALIEKMEKIGGNVLKWDRLFPSKRPASEVLNYLNGQMNNNISLFTSTELYSVQKNNHGFTLHLTGKNTITADALLLTTGFNLFDAQRKEEYGYGIYDNVITSADLETRFTKRDSLLTAQGKPVKRIGFVHCVGSRDEKVGNPYCSKLCCVTAVKQAIEVKEQDPEIQVYCFYMDLRMFDLKFEALYKEAQEKHGITFVRGRLSESCENADGSIIVKVEDTLVGKPLRMTLDMLVLMVGMEPSKEAGKYAQMLGINQDSSGFFAMADAHLATNLTAIPGVFVAGTCTGPANIANTLTDARAAATQVATYLKDLKMESSLE